MAIFSGAIGGAVVLGVIIAVVVVLLIKRRYISHIIKVATYSVFKCFCRVSANDNDNSASCANLKPFYFVFIKSECRHG